MANLANRITSGKAVKALEREAIQTARNQGIDLPFLLSQLNSSENNIGFEMDNASSNEDLNFVNEWVTIVADIITALFASHILQSDPRSTAKNSFESKSILNLQQRAQLVIDLEYLM